MKLIAVEKSTREGKKWMAVFYDKETGKKKLTHFGSEGMDDYTIGKTTKEQRERYRTRHKKDLETGDPTKAGFLSYYILWGDSTSRQKNISDYRKKFNL